ncbi:MAG TPA: type II toxin-antitoxin system VapC family toxin, partial [Myxococcota bacterium]|nr:type II toxin-antitoxin system VapC family toxin [Myxococcota bacterium]
METTKIIIDTHVFLWLNHSPERFTDEIRTLITLPTTVLFLSSASALEISIKYYLKKLSLPLKPEEY